MKKIIQLAVFTLLLVIMWMPQTTKANENTEIPYSVTPIFNAHQQEGQLGYFDLLVKPGVIETIGIEISNGTDKEIKVRVTPNTAKTTTNGTIDYSGMNLKSTKNLPISFEKITSSSQIVTIPADGKKVATFTIKVPEKSFAGIILGGFYIQQELDQEEKEAKKKASVAIQNEFSFILGCQLRMSNEPVQKKFELDNVHLDSYGGYFSIVSEIANEAPVLLSSLSVKGEIKTKAGKSVYQFEKETFSIAPNSIYGLPERIKSEDLKPGEYQMHLRISSKDGKQTWDLSKSFTVTKEKKAEVLKETIDEKEPTNPLIYIGLAIIGLLIVLIIVVLVKKKK